MVDLSRSCVSCWLQGTRYVATQAKHLERGKVKKYRRFSLLYEYFAKVLLPGCWSLFRLFTKVPWHCCVILLTYLVHTRHLPIYPLLRPFSDSYQHPRVRKTLELIDQLAKIEKAAGNKTSLATVDSNGGIPPSLSRSPVSVLRPPYPPGHIFSPSSPFACLAPARSII